MALFFRSTNDTAAALTEGVMPGGGELTHLCHVLAEITMFIGVVIILYGLIRCLLSYVVHEVRSFTRNDTERDLDRIRGRLGAYLLLGLEFAVASDIIFTMLEPSRDAMLLLAGLVVIRTLIAWFIGKEREEIRKDLEAAA